MGGFSSVSVLYYMLDAQLYFTPQKLHQSKHNVPIMLNCFFT